MRIVTDNIQTDTPKRKRPPIEGKGTLSHQLRTIVKNQDASPYAIAKRAGISPRVLARFVAGSRGLTLASADRLAMALNLRIGEGFASPTRAKTKSMPSRKNTDR